MSERAPSPQDIFRIVHAGHDVMEVPVVSGPIAPPLICLTCHEEQGDD